MKVWGVPPVWIKTVGVWESRLPKRNSATRADIDLAVEDDGFGIGYEVDGFDGGFGGDAVLAAAARDGDDVAGLEGSVEV